jgi:hypothetical protein
MQDPQCFRLNPKLGQLNTTHHMSNAMIVEGAKDEALVEDIRDGGVHIHDMCLEFAWNFFFLGMEACHGWCENKQLDTQSFFAIIARQHKC